MGIGGKAKYHIEPVSITTTCPQKMAKVIRLVENLRGFSSTNRHVVFYRHDYDASLADNSHVFFREFDYVGCNWELQLARWSFFDAGPEEDVIILDQYNLEAAAFWFAIGVQRNLHLAKLLAQRVTDGDGVTLEHGSGGAMENAKRQLNSRSLIDLLGFCPGGRFFLDWLWRIIFIGWGNHLFRLTLLLVGLLR